MKKIAILLTSMKTGGIEKVSIEFMRRLIKEFDVTLFLRCMEGELLNSIPKEVHVKQIDKKKFINELLRLLKKFKIFSFLYYLMKYVWAVKIKKNFVLTSKLSSSIVGAISEEKFDLAINYHGAHMEDISDVLYRINAKKKIAFIHGDHDFHGKKIISSMNSEYDKFDKIFCVSSFTKNKFIKDFPLIKDKAEVYYNPINEEEIKDKSKELLKEPFDKKFINIVTVGRISKEKGQDLIPPSVQFLKEKGYDLRWYIIGDGADQKRIEDLAEKFNVKKEIKFVNGCINPYSFMKNADIYVQPSYTEGYSLTIAEAGVLGKAIIATNVCGIKEEIKNNEVIFTDVSVNAIATEIEKILLNSEKKKELEDKIKIIDFSHTKEINKILELV